MKGAHLQRATRRWILRVLVAAAAVSAAGAGTAGALAATAATKHGPPAPGPSSPAGEPSHQTTTTTAPPAPLSVASSTPANGATSVDGSQPVTFTTNANVDLAAVQPTISPAIPGQWSSSGDHLTFTPQGAFPPDTTVTVTLPAGLRSDQGGKLAAAQTVSFKTGVGSVLRLQQILATLGYLPLHWAPSAPVSTTPASQQRYIYDPPAGTFSWAWPSVPPTLAATWTPNSYTVLVKGAVMAFQADHNLTMNGITTEPVWEALIGTTAPNPHGYTYALASKTLPETLTVWHNGTVVSKTLANTGIPQSPTADGTFPVYERLASQVMKGINPNGTHYADPVSWVAYFNGGDAVHYISRASYGSPQSLGCVELPYSVAKAVWPYLTYGTLVTVAG